MAQIVKLSMTLALAATLAHAQPLELSTGFSTDNGQAGCMFDLVATDDILVLGFDVNLDRGTWDVEIWTKAGTFAGFEQDPSAWTLATSVTGVFSLAADRATRIPTSLCLPVANGSTMGVYVTVTNGVGLNYSTGTAVGTVNANDNNLEIREGSGIVHPFGPFFPGRIWSGTVYYELGTGTSCSTLSPADPPPFQPNGSVASFDLDGVQTDGLTAARITRCPDIDVTVTFSAPVGLTFDVAVDSIPLIASGTELPSGTQRINVDTSSSTLRWLFGVSAPNFIGFPLQTVSSTIRIPVAGTVSGQATYLEPSAPDGVILTQGVELETVDSVTLPSGPVFDEQIVTVDLATPPVCIGGLAVQGTTYTQVHVSSNGRVQFGSPVTDFSPTVAEALTGPAFIGVWGDLDPGSGGLIALSSPTGGGLRVEWQDVPPFSGGGTPATFGVAIDPLGILTIDGTSRGSLEAGLRGWRRDAFLGWSPGGMPGATDPGAQVFLVGGTMNMGVASAMAYRFDAAERLLAGTAVQSITFAPDTAGVYTWTAQ